MLPRRPWNTSQMSTEKWKLIQPEWVDTEYLQPANAVDPKAVARKLAEPASSYGCDDVFPHIVEHGGLYWIEDGHHRIAAARALGNRFVIARVLRDA